MDPNNLPDFNTFFDEIVEDLFNDNSVEEFLRLALERQNNGKHRRRRTRSSAHSMGQETTKRKAKSKVENASSSNMDTSGLEAAIRKSHDLRAEYALVKKNANMAKNLLKWDEIVTKDTSEMSEQQKADHVLCCDAIMRQLCTYEKEGSTTRRDSSPK